MALQMTTTITMFDKELVFANAYHQVVNINGDKNLLNFTLFVYKNREKQELIEKFNYHFVPDISESSHNFIKQAYEFLKTREDYSGAIDVLED